MQVGSYNHSGSAFASLWVDYDNVWGVSDKPIFNVFTNATESLLNCKWIFKIPSKSEEHPAVDAPAVELNHQAIHTQPPEVVW